MKSRSVSEAGIPEYSLSVSDHSKKAKAAVINSCSEEYSALGAITMTISCSEAEGVKHKLPNSKASIEKISYCGKAVRQAVQERRGKNCSASVANERITVAGRVVRQKVVRASRAEGVPSPSNTGSHSATERRSIPKRGRSYAAAWRQAAAQCRRLRHQGGRQADSVPPHPAGELPSRSRHRCFHKEEQTGHEGL